MESCPNRIFYSTLNLFEDEEASPENLKVLMKTPVGYNSSK
jgi:hypothetical protein